MELRGVLTDLFFTHLRIHLGIYLNAGPICLTRLAEITSCPLSQFSATVFSSLSLKTTLFHISVWNPDWVPNLGCMGLAPDFSLELSQQFLSFASSMGIVMQEDDTITQHVRAFASDGFTMAQ
ncbi:hypothetical protein AVEN_249944-1 [Araneus ventricosus]|uniref:Uncharacterized protein n=1 Tax=Araneus ventricosus TaxID=182803 RepID=A0A4Y2K2C8_ARAVE|nr:hypothetical protein AVEN_249944-1 [Araneus ventricosus]